MTQKLPFLCRLFGHKNFKFMWSSGSTYLPDHCVRCGMTPEDSAEYYIQKKE